MARKPTEFDIQRAICIWLDGGALLPDAVFFHVPNGGSRNALEGVRFKQSGVKAGVPDLLFLRSHKIFALELKAEDGHVSAAQIAMQTRFRLAGAMVATCYSLRDARAQIFSWGLTSST